MRAVRLNKSELEKVVSKLRLVDKFTRDLVAPIIWHLRYLEEKIIKLETELREIKQSELDLGLSESKKVLRDKALLEQIEQRNVQHSYFPLKKRLKLMIERDQIGTLEWNNTLKWNKLTHDQAIKMAKE